jgi:hypothetical protein
MRKPYDYGEPEYYQGRLYGILGEKAKATDLFRTALSKGIKYELWVTFSHDPDQVDLIDYPEFRKLMEDFK